MPSVLPDHGVGQHAASNPEPDRHGLSVECPGEVADLDHYELPVERAWAKDPVGEYRLRS
jgi:hypothetical protein